MKKAIISLITVVSMIGLAGCSTQDETITKEKEDKLKVYASFYPMYDFAKNIGKDKIDLQLMIDSGVEPHDWEPSARLLAQMEEADVFIYNGLEMEPWADKLVKSIDNESLEIVEASKGTDLIKSEEHPEEEEHSEEEEHGEYDPHVWLNPMNAIKEAENIKNALVKADEKNKDFYEQNYSEFAKKLNELDKEYKEETSKFKTKEIVVAHKAFTYLANSYNLEQIAISGLSPQEEPSPAKMAQISDFAKDNNVKYIFFETLASPKLAEVLAKEVGAKTAVLNPLEGLTKEEIKQGKDYIKVMKENLETLKKALAE